MSIELPALPYQPDALEPILSKETIDFHYGKHHTTYVVNLNKLIENTELENKSLEEIISATANDSTKVGIFNNAAQIWNHTFYWNSMTSNPDLHTPFGSLAAQIDKDFGSYDQFKEQFTAAGLTQFGSGWAWLVKSKQNKLEIHKSANAATPLTEGVTPLLTMDVWEHAYYIDYRNARPKYINVFLEKLVNWEFAENNFIQ